jgi:hypothetical protein
MVRSSVDPFHPSGGDEAMPDAIRSRRGGNELEAPAVVFSSAVPFSYVSLAGGAAIASLGHSRNQATEPNHTPQNAFSATVLNTAVDLNPQHGNSPSSSTPSSLPAFLENELMVQKSRPSNRKPVKSQVAATSEWTQSIIGRDWEVYWKKSTCRLILPSPKKQALFDSEDEGGEDDEETWYDATVLALDEGKSQRSSSSRTNKTYFQVRFLGDNDKLYSMALSPDLVRPSARAWIRRTKALLQQPHANTGTATTEYSTKQWEEALPPDTAILMLDRAELKRVEQDLQRDFAIFHVARFHNASDESSNAAFSKLRSEHAACSQLMKLIRTQMFLRTKLAPVEMDENEEDDEEELSNNDGGENEKDDEESVVTETYVDYLQQCLNDLERACQWHYQCWKLLHRLFAVDRNYQQPPPSISREHLIRNFLALGRYTLTSLLLQDPSCGAFQRKSQSRKRSHEASTGGEAAAAMQARHSKRLRTIPEQWLVSTFAPRDTCDQDDESLLSSWDMVKTFVSQVCETDQRWYTKYLGNMLCSISFMVVSPYMKWERSALSFLGNDAVNGAPATENSSTSHRENDSSGTLVKYEEIEILIESANHDRLLKCFTLSGYVTRLCEKLAVIDAFEVRAWDLIVAVLEEPEVSTREEDPTLSGLKELCAEARMKDGPIANVRPIGRSTSRLYPEVLDNAIIYRQWFLDLKHAESVRERMAFIQGLVARLSELPPLPARSDAEESIFDEKSRIRLDGVMFRVRCLSDLCLKHVPKFNHFQSLLSERCRNDADRGSGFCSFQGATEALMELQSLPVISSVEEMLAIRCDVLSWECDAQKVLTMGREPTFADLRLLYRGIEEIRMGSSQYHKSTVEGTQNTSLVDAEMTAFVQSEFSSEVLSQLVRQTQDLFSRSRSWKDRVDAMIESIQSFRTHGAHGLEHSLASEKIDLKTMDELRAEYFSLEVDISETYDALLKIHTPAVEWMTTMKNTLSNDSVPFEEMLHFLIRKEPCRPLGIKIEPDRDVVQSMQELLRWYVSVQDFIAKGNRDSELLRSLIFVGLQVLSRFCQKRNAGTQFTVPAMAAEFLVASTIHREMCKSLDIAELYKDPVSCNVIERMSNDYQDDSRGAPMFFLLLSLWALYVDDFVVRCVDVKMRAESSLVRAKELWTARPVSSSSSTGQIAAKDMMLSLRVADLERLVQDGETTVRETQSLLESAECICQDCLFDAIEPTLGVLKEKLANFKGRQRNVGMVTLDFKMESQLEHCVKLFSWLVSIFSF